MNHEIYLSVIIPAYNEERRISQTLLDVDRYLSKQKYEYEILVVNDGSSDKTARIVQNFQTVIKNLELIDNQKNQGQRYAVRQGLLESKGKYRLFMDADNSTTIDHIGKMWLFFEQGFDVVIGSRDSKDVKGARQTIPQPFIKRMLGNFGNFLIQIVAVWGIWDTQCGFKALTARAVKDIFSRAVIDRWGFDIEVLVLARALGYKIAKIPVYWINEPDSKVTWRGYLRTFQELFQIKLNLIRDKYHIKK